MVKVHITIDKEMYEVLTKIEELMESLVNYFETIEIQVCDEKGKKGTERTGKLKD